MIEAIGNYIKQHGLFEEGTRLIVAVSGGVDSMVLLDLMRQLSDTWKLELVVAHMNFGLRGKESDMDQDLVADYCEAHRIRLEVRKVDTKAFQEEKKMGVQEAARNLRYDWFKELKQNERTRVAVAHHADDNLETIIYNLTKGTGIRGLRGMKPVNEQGVVRPLLGLTKDDLVSYAQQHQIAWREDSSNQKTDYRRNLIRLKVMPILKQINPSVSDHFERTHTRLLGMEEVLVDRAEELRNKHLSVKANRHELNTSWVTNSEGALLVLEEILKSYHVRSSDANDIFSAIGSPMGQVFRTDTHQLNVDRGVLIIEGLSKDQDEAPMPILKGEKKVNYGKWEYKLTYQKVKEVTITSNRKMAYLDIDKLEFPLSLRKWTLGDRMQPFGMYGQKKISDMLINEKVSNIDKTYVQVLCSGDEIVWLCGIRISHLARVTNDTKNVLTIEQK
jgi:tRNA(Ile)-lysidine synthase